MIKSITKNECDYELLRKEAIEKFNNFSRGTSLFMHCGLVDWILNSQPDFSSHMPLEKIDSPRLIQSELVHALANLIIH
jgi:hypothetical protein